MDSLAANNDPEAGRGTVPIARTETHHTNDHVEAKEAFHQAPVANRDEQPKKICIVTGEYCNPVKL